MQSDEELLDSHPRSRLWTVTYVCAVALQCFFILGFAGGFTSPVLSELSDVQDGYRSLRKKSDQDLFNVRNYFNYKIFILRAVRAIELAIDERVYKVSIPHRGIYMTLP